MKKLLSLSLAVVMMTCLLAGMTANAVSTNGTYEYYYFSYANLVDRTIANNSDRTLKTDMTAYPGPNSTLRMYPVNATWYSDSSPNQVGGTTNSLVNYDQHSGLYYFNTARATSADVSTSVDVYVNNGGVYTIWAMVPYADAPYYSQNTVPPTDATFKKINSGWKVAVNGGAAQAIGNELYDYNDTVNNIVTVTRYKNTSYTEYKNMYYWDKVNVELAAGKNTITLTSAAVNTSIATTAHIASMFVTNDNARSSSTFAYIGTFDAWSTAGGTGNSYLNQNIKYFADGQYHEDWATDGFINLREYSDLDAPTVTINEANAVVTDNTITFDWAAVDPKREYVGKYNPVWNGTASDKTGAGYAGDGVNPSTFYADASGIYETRIYENGVLLTTITDGKTSYTYDAPFTGSGYNFKVEVIDHFGNVAEASAVFRTTGPADTQPPTWSGEIEVANASFSSTITWPEATDNTELLGYEIYEGSVAPENLVELVTKATTSYTFSLNPGDTKDIIVVAKDRVGLYSSELSATVASLAGTENYVIRQEHFDVPDAALRIWTRTNISSAMIDAGCPPLNQGSVTPYTRGNTVDAKTGGAEMSAKVWVDTPGEYTAFMNVLQNGSGIHVSLNGQKTNTAFGTNVAVNDAGVSTWGWVKADRTWHLNAGWNTITVTSVTNSGSFGIIYLTNGTTVAANELTYKTHDNTVVTGGKLNLAAYDDVKAPTFAAGNVTTAYDSVAKEIAITWPAATDEAENTIGSSNQHQMSATGLQRYKVFVNDKEIKDVDNVTTALTINSALLGRELVPGEVINIRVEALDLYGNKASKTLPYEVSKFVISSFNIQNSTGAADALILLNDGTVKAEAVIKNVSEAAADVRLAIAIYDATGNLLFGDEVDHTVAADAADDTITVTISGAPTDLTGCTVKAHLWHAGDLSPASTQWTTITIQ